MLVSFLHSRHHHHCVQTGCLKVSLPQGELSEEHVHYITQCAFSEVLRDASQEFTERKSSSLEGILSLLQRR